MGFGFLQVFVNSVQDEKFCVINTLASLISKLQRVEIALTQGDNLFFSNLL